MLHVFKDFIQISVYQRIDELLRLDRETFPL
jgi:hypothetical protein